MVDGWGGWAIKKHPLVSRIGRSAHNGLGRLLAHSGTSVDQARRVLVLSLKSTIDTAATRLKNIWTALSSMDTIDLSLTIAGLCA
jgi:hypothetical protein